MTSATIICKKTSKRIFRAPRGKISTVKKPQDYERMDNMKKIGACLTGGAAGLCVGMAVALAATSKATAGMCLKKNIKKMTKAASGAIDSIKNMMG